MSVSALSGKIKEKQAGAHSGRKLYFQIN